MTYQCKRRKIIFKVGINAQMISHIRTILAKNAAHRRSKKIPRLLRAQRRFWNQQILQNATAPRRIVNIWKRATESKTPVGQILMFYQISKAHKVKMFLIQLLRLDSEIVKMRHVINQKFPSTTKLSE